MRCEKTLTLVVLNAIDGSTTSKMPESGSAQIYRLVPISEVNISALTKGPL